MITFIGIADGVIAAALLNGIPSATCYAMAETYQIAVFWFFMSACLCVATYFMGFMLRTTNFRYPSVLLWGSTVFAMFALLATAVGAVTGASNLEISVNHCLSATAGPDAAHQRVPLLRIFYFWRKI